MEREDIITWPGACFIKLITAVINSITQKASVFVRASKKWLAIAKALAYCTTESITAVKSFMIQDPGQVIMSSIKNSNTNSQNLANLIHFTDFIQTLNFVICHKSQNWQVCFIYFSFSNFQGFRIIHKIREY